MNIYGHWARSRRTRGGAATPLDPLYYPLKAKMSDGLVSNGFSGVCVQLLLLVGVALLHPGRFRWLAGLGMWEAWNRDAK